MKKILYIYYKKYELVLFLPLIYVNILKQELPVPQRGDAVMSLVYEAGARVRDPVYGCVGAISYLQNQVSQLQMQLAVAQAEILCIQMQQDHSVFPNCPQIHSDDKPPSSLLLPPPSPPPSQCLSFASSPNVIYDAIFGHDIVS